MEEGPALTTDIGWPAGIAVTPSGEILIADSTYGLVRKVDLSGNVRTVAGSWFENNMDLPSEFPDGSLARQVILQPEGVAVSNDGTIYFINGSQDIEMIDVPPPGESARIKHFFGKKARKKGEKCGTGKMDNKTAQANVADAIQTSLSVICPGTLNSLRIKDTCPSPGGSTTIIFAQSFNGGNSNIVQVVKPCAR